MCAITKSSCSFCYAYVSMDLTKNPRKKRLLDHNAKNEFFREGRNCHDRLRQSIFHLLMKNHWIELKYYNVMQFFTNAEFIILWNILLNNFSSILMFTACKRSLGQGNIFRSVCQQFCLRGGCFIPGGCFLGGGVLRCSGNIPRGAPQQALKALSW